MVASTISGVRMAGLASAVPDGVRDNADAATQFGAEETQKICDSIGVRKRRVAPPAVCASDLCLTAAERLLEDLAWERDSVAGLVFVSQTPDYRLPATSCVLHGRLGLAPGCAAFDVSLGCSGYVYGLWLAGQMAASLRGRVLLLVGDTINKLVSPDDRATALLFGDAGSATALEPDPNAEPWRFVLGSEGQGWRHLRADGGYRQSEAAAPGQYPPHAEHLHLNGAEVFSFTLREVPKLLAETLDLAGWTVDTLDAAVMHQANEFMLRHLAKRAKIPLEKLVLALAEYGNTSCASIPLAMTHALANQLQTAPQRLLLAGFGVGWSWGAAAITCGPLAAPPLATSFSEVSAAG